MTLGTLVLYIGIGAAIFTLLVGFVWKRHHSWTVTFLQNFCGILFIFSGFVKAIDPLGTAYKMEQYFTEFETTFADTWLSFLAPLFPWLSEHSVVFSVIMIVFEILLGIMLVTGTQRKFTAWAFLILVAFFTALTGFTYLTGYVPSGANFFEFGKWGEYVSTNMKVTDCGCFGDFLKLEPKVSFLKDVVLLVPALLFVFRHRDMHQLFTPRFRSALSWVAVFALTLFCVNNYAWNLPPVDFRPFFVGQNVREKKAAEREAEENVEIIAYKLKNKESGQVIEMPFDQYMKEYKSYPKEEWEFEQVRSEPAVARTKISDFEVQDLDGNDVTEDILSEPGYAFMIVSYKLYGETEPVTETVNDTTWVADTVFVEGTDSFMVEQKAESVTPREETRDKFVPEADYVKRYTNLVNPIAEAGKADGVKTYMITAFSDPARIADFKGAAGVDFPVYLADDILLKTIVRSNPGFVLMKDGVVVMKWHWKQVPDYEEIKSKYITK